MLQHVVFAMRESPDWAALSRDYRAGVAIDPARYAHPRDIPSFPTNIVDLIGRWNAFSPLDFFACRQRLREIAAGLLAQVAQSVVVPHAGLSAILEGLAHQPYFVLFCDDDDWFAPDLFAVLAGLDMTGADVAVFPLVRLSASSFTLAREGSIPRAAVGPCFPFVLRYHTNNYALAPQACLPGELARLREHRTASETADRLGFIDRDVDRVISATNKTPCSASLLRDVVRDASGFREYVSTYLRQLKRLVIPAELSWISAPLWETIRLFESVAKIT